MATKYPGITRLRDGRYRVRVKARDPKTGRMIDIRAKVEATSIADAFAKREKLRHEAESAGTGMHTRVRLGECADSWLRMKLPALRASTRRHYADTLDLHILPSLGEYFLEALAPDDIVRWRDEQAKQLVGAQRRPISPTTVNTRMRVLKQLLADVTHERGLRDPCARIEGMRVHRRRVPKGLEAHDVRAVLDVMRIEYPRWYPVAMTLALTGARWSEVTALQWTHLDEERGMILFQQGHVRGVIDDTKTSIVKEVPLMPELAAILHEHRAALIARNAVGLDAGWVFPSTKGTLMQPSSLRGPLHAACKKAGVRPISPHGLRYTFNHLAKRVASADVTRSITGHVTEEMTRHYDWVLDDEKTQAVRSVLRLVTTAQRPGGPAPSVGGTSGGAAASGNDSAG